MELNLKTGLVDVLDLGGDAPVTIAMYPVDAREAMQRGGVLDDGTPRYVLSVGYVPAPPAPPKKL